MKTIISSLYKFRKTKGYLIHIILPAIGVVLFSLYSLISGYSEIKKIALFLEFITIMMPGVITVVVSIQYENERKAGLFQNILSYPGSRIESHVINLLPMLLWGFVALAIGITGFGIVMNIIGFNTFTVGWYIKISLCVFGSNIFNYLVSYMLCYSFGYGISLGFGVIGTIMAALLRLDMCDMFWKYMPCSYGIRIVLTEVKTKLNEYTDYASLLQSNLKNGLFFVYVLTIVSIIVYLLWSYCWQGNRSEE